MLALFDDDTNQQEKQQIATALINTPRPAQFATCKPEQPDFDPVFAHIGGDKPSMAAFVTDRSWLLFHLLETDPAWLAEDPDD